MLALTTPQVLQPLIDASQRFGWQDGLWSVALLVIGVAFGWLAGRLLEAALRRWVSMTDTLLDDAALRHLVGPLKALLPLIGLRIAISGASMPEQLQTGLAKVFLVLVIAGVGWFILRALALVETIVDTRFDLDLNNNVRARSVHTQVRVLRNIAGFVVVTLTIGMILMSFEAVRQLGTGLLASAGVAGVIIGFAAQRSIATIVGGIQLALTQPVRVDDVLIVEGEWGRVEEITLTYVVVRIWDLRRLVVPITYFLEKPFQNWTRTSADLLGTVELELDFSIPIDPLRDELHRLLKDHELWDGKVWNVQVTDADGRTMRVRAMMSASDAGKLWDLRCFVREHLIAFVERNYPQALPRDRAVWVGETPKVA